MRNIIIVAFVGIALMFSSCGKYEEGPALSLRTKKARAIGVWKYEKVLYDGVEQNVSLYSDVEFELMKDDKYQVRIGNVIVSEGTWNFGSGKETIETLESGSSTKDVETIVRLTNKEFWTSITEDGHTSESHFVAAD